ERQNALHVAQEAFASIVPDFSIRTSLLDANHAYKQALAMETKAIEYYSSLLTELKNPHEREAVAVILEEEQKHESIMESIIDFIQRTDDWLEEDNGFHT
ncbi:MAG: hypothetical protein JW795_01090, partial [Chitinivibrionales bacterium]|nr:hypothetical protein [Chitinivibrionales bacterium]